MSDPRSPESVPRPPRTAPASPDAAPIPIAHATAIETSREDPAAFTVLFDRHYDAIAGFLRRRVEASLADELAAQTFLEAFDARDRYDPSLGDARPWLFGIASHLLSRHRRAESRRWRAFARAAADSGVATSDGLDAVDARLDASALSATLAAGLEGLRPVERDVLLLHAWAELTYEQIATALGIPIGTVRSRMHRARLRLRARLDELSAVREETR